ncbi:MAG: hypothetical protein ACQESN_11315 [Thermotogota bacterium]
MKRKNKLFLLLLLLGALAVFIGAILKLNGNPNAEYLLMTGTILEPVSIILLIIYNYSKIRDNLLK